MIPVELLNAWGGAWFGLMTRTLIETSVLLALILVVWLPLRRRMSAQLAHGLFCLVLLKLIVPVPLTGSGWQPLAWARQAAERVSAWALPGEAPPAAAVAVAPPAPWVLPATGDVGCEPGGRRRRLSRSGSPSRRPRPPEPSLGRRPIPLAAHAARARPRFRSRRS